MSRMPRRRTAKAHYPRAVIPATELLPDLERRRLRALVSADMATAGPLHAADYQLITPSGRETGSASSVPGPVTSTFRLRAR
jgi:hypothetical protein